MVYGALGAGPPTPVPAGSAFFRDRLPTSMQHLFACFPLKHLKHAANVKAYNQVGAGGW